MPTSRDHLKRSSREVVSSLEDNTKRALLRRLGRLAPVTNRSGTPTSQPRIRDASHYGSVPTAVLLRAATGVSRDWCVERTRRRNRDRVSK